MRVGSKDKAKAKQEYDLVFEDQIDFIMDRVESGNLDVRFSSLYEALICDVHQCWRRCMAM